MNHCETLESDLFSLDSLVEMFLLVRFVDLDSGTRHILILSES